MSRSFRMVAIIACLALLSPLCLAAGSMRGKSPYMAGVVILKLHVIPTMDGKSGATGQDRVDAVLSAASCSSVRQLYPHKAKATDAVDRGLARICEANVALGTDIPALCAKLNATGQIAYAEPRYGYKPELTPNDPSYASQYALANIDAALAWDVTIGDTNVVIAICDNAVQWDHPDLAANIWINHGEIVGNGIDDDGNGYIDDMRGWDFAGASLVNLTDADNDPMEPSNIYINNIHGTHIAGDASEVANNGVGGAGIGYRCRLMALKCSPDDSLAYAYNGAGIYYGFDAIVYAADNGADIINCSWGGYTASSYTNEIVQYATGKGSLVVAAAGNGGSDGIGDSNDSTHCYPSDYDNVVGVAAVNASDIKAGFSNYGRIIDVSAPGVDIYSTIYNGTYGSTGWSGTSMASPIVAGVAALVKSVHPTWTNICIGTHLNKTGENIDGLNPSYAGRLGTRVNAYNAVSQPALPLIKYVAHYISSDDNGNGIAQAGESATLRVVVKNWWGDATGVSAVLGSTDYAVTIPMPIGSYGAVSNGSQDTANFSFHVDASALPHQALFTLQTNADGQLRTDSFYVQIDVAPILYVDDDDNSNNVDTFYTRAFGNLGAVYDYYNWSANGTPDSLFLVPYKAVIWSCEWTFPSLNSDDRATLRYYLNQGGKLYVSGQDVGWDLCDTISDPNYAHSYNADPAGCLDFYNNYLHATYMADAPGTVPWTGNLYGVNGDTLGNGLTSGFTQPGRGTNQFPDTFNVLAGASKIFSYTSATGPSGGLRYENGATKVVYTGFGYEAMTTTATRQEFMRRILKWFLGDITLSHTQLSDTEDTLNSYRVTAVATSSVGIGTVRLFYNLDGYAPFENQLAMTRVGATDTFVCYIPAQHNTQVQYYIVADNANAVKSVQPSNAPLSFYSFYAGPDAVPPAITHTVMGNTINLAGPYRVNMSANDSYGVFNDSSYIHFRINSGAEQPPVQMIGNAGSFNGLITLPAPIHTWDTIGYYITAIDMSSRRNVGRSPAAGYHSFVAADSELVSNFDSPAAKAAWDTVNGGFIWRSYTSVSHSASTSMRTGITNYPANADFRMTLRPEYSYNLDAYADNAKWVRLYYWQRGRIYAGTGDTLMVEGSKDNAAWTLLEYSVAFNSLTTWIADSIDLSSFLSSKGDNDSVTFRFRLKSDASGAQFGWLVDDVYLKVEPILGVAGLPVTAVLPRFVGLSQNQPNPFAGRTVINYQLPRETPVRLKIYNVAGQTVRTLVDGRQPAGCYNLKWDGADDQGRRLSAGVYLYRLDAGAATITKKLVVVK